MNRWQMSDVMDIKIGLIVIRVEYRNFMNEVVDWFKDKFLRELCGYFRGKQDQYLQILIWLIGAYLQLLYNIW